MERETGLEPATSSLGIQPYFESKPLARFCCEFLNLQHLAESAFSIFDRPIEAQTRHVRFQSLDASRPPRSDDSALPSVAVSRSEHPTRSLRGWDEPRGVPRIDAQSKPREISQPREVTAMSCTSRKSLVRPTW